MLAVSHALDRVFLYEPGAGMSVPVVLDLETSKLKVAVPKVADLEANYFALEGLAEVKVAVSGHNKLIDAVARFSRFYSDHFRKEIDSNNVTVAGLRNLVGSHYASVSSQLPVNGSAKNPSAISAGTQFDPVAAATKFA